MIECRHCGHCRHWHPLGKRCQAPRCKCDCYDIAPAQRETRSGGEGA